MPSRIINQLFALMQCCSMFKLEQNLHDKLLEKNLDVNYLQKSQNMFISLHYKRVIALNLAFSIIKMHFIKCHFSIFHQVRCRVWRLLCSNWLIHKCMKFLCILFLFLLCFQLFKMMHNLDFFLMMLFVLHF